MAPVRYTKLLKCQQCGEIKSSVREVEHGYDSINLCKSCFEGLVEGMEFEQSRRGKWVKV